MKNTSISNHSPSATKHLTFALIALVIIIPFWMIFTTMVLPPSFLEEHSMIYKIFWWLTIPLIAVGMLASWQWTAAKSKLSDQHAQILSPEPGLQAGADINKKHPTREYVLEVIGLGVSFEKYRQGNLWEALVQGHPHASIRDTDPKKVPWEATAKGGVEGGRGGDALENGAKNTPNYWVAPVFNAMPPIHNDSIESPAHPYIGLAEGTMSSGMLGQLYVAASRRFEERPDHILEDVFAFFDKYPDIPYVVVNSNDGMDTRDDARAPNTAPLVKDGYYISEMPDSAALFVLARRERVDALRSGAFEDINDGKVSSEELNEKGYARRVFLDYLNLNEKLKNLSLDRFPSPRRPTVDEWLLSAAELAKRPDMRGERPHSYLDALHPQNDHPPKSFKPTPWFPIPWNKDQISFFDKLPTLGFIHRPVFVKTADEHGRPLTRHDERLAALTQGWQQALDTLPESQRKIAPARVVVATGGQIDQTVALTSMLNHWTAEGGPQLDNSKPAAWIDVDSRLGNTGAATLMMEMAIGIMGSYRDGGATAAINLRDPGEATIVFITPPSDDKRKTQQHPEGGDVFRNTTSPAIDLNNYKQ